jgi:hypothetical protein
MRFVGGEDSESLFPRKSQDGCVVDAIAVLGLAELAHGPHIVAQAPQAKDQLHVNAFVGQQVRQH